METKKRKEMNELPIEPKRRAYTTLVLDEMRFRYMYILDFRALFSQSCKHFVFHFKFNEVRNDMVEYIFKLLQLNTAIKFLDVIEAIPDEYQKFVRPDVQVRIIPVTGYRSNNLPFEKKRKFVNYWCVLSFLLSEMSFFLIYNYTELRKRTLLDLPPHDDSSLSQSQLDYIRLLYEKTDTLLKLMCMSDVLERIPVQDFNGEIISDIRCNYNALSIGEYMVEDVDDQLPIREHLQNCLERDTFIKDILEVSKPSILNHLQRDALSPLALSLYHIIGMVKNIWSPVKMYELVLPFPQDQEQENIEYVIDLAKTYDEKSYLALLAKNHIDGVTVSKKTLKKFYNLDRFKLFENLKEEGLDHNEMIPYAYDINDDTGDYQVIMYIKYSKKTNAIPVDDLIMNAFDAVDAAQAQAYDEHAQAYDEHAQAQEHVLDEEDDHPDPGEICSLVFDRTIFKSMIALRRYLYIFGRDTGIAITDIMGLHISGKYIEVVLYLESGCKSITRWGKLGPKSFINFHKTVLYEAMNAMTFFKRDYIHLDMFTSAYISKFETRGYILHRLVPEVSDAPKLDLHILSRWTTTFLQEPCEFETMKHDELYAGYHFTLTNKAFYDSGCNSMLLAALDERHDTGFCGICKDSHTKEVMCSFECGHQSCRNCTIRGVYSHAQDPINSYFDEPGKIPCLICKRRSINITSIPMLSNDFTDHYFKAVERNTERRISLLFSRSKQPVVMDTEDENMNEGVSTTKIQTHIDYILNHILCITCPHCTQVLADFDGCFALECNRCESHLCGWCLRVSQTSDESHKHVTQCPKNLVLARMNDSSIATDTLYGDIQDFYKSHRDSISKNLENYLSKVVYPECKTFQEWSEFMNTLKPHLDENIVKI